MKLRGSFPLQQLLFAACGLAAAAAIEFLPAFAQAQAPTGAQAVFKVKGSAATQQGTVIGASASGVQIQIGTQTLTLPPSMFESFQMAAPPEYVKGYQAFTAGDYAKALTLVKPVTDKYRGLPAEWAQYATGMLGDIYVNLGDYSKAEAAYADFKKLYQTAGNSSPTAEVGLARIAYAKKDLPGAKAKLEPITTEALAALKDKPIPAAKGFAYSQAFLVSGMVKEAEGDLPGALEDYLRTVTLFYQDRAAAAQAQDKADALRARDKEHPVTVP